MLSEVECAPRRLPVKINKVRGVLFAEALTLRCEALDDILALFLAYLACLACISSLHGVFVSCTTPRYPKLARTMTTERIVSNELAD